MSREIEKLIEMDIGYNVELKETYRKVAIKFLKKIAKDACLQNVETIYNPGGIAVSGDVILKGTFPDGRMVEIRLCADGPSRGIMFRRIVSYSDYTGGRNIWIKINQMKTINDKDIANVIHLNT